MIKFLDLKSQYTSIKKEIDMAINSTIEQSAYIGGSSVESFQHSFGTYQDAKFCVGVANGTDALEIAIKCLELPPNSEIIVPSNSFISTAEAVTNSGPKIIFGDIDEFTYNLNFSDVERKITPRTAAVIAVHLYGQPCDLDQLMDLGRIHNLKIIEDCAQAHGAEYFGQRVGAIGEIGTFSFYPGKNLGAYGDAGAIVTNNKSLAQKAKMIANHGRIAKYDHIIEGRNSRLDGLQAAILSVKLKFLESWLEHRIKISKLYLEGLRNTGDIILPTINKNRRHVFHLFVIRTKYREELRAHLTSKNIETGIHYPIALPKLEAYQYMKKADSNMIANKLDGELLSLPIGEHLSLEQIQEVIEEIDLFFK